MKKFKFSLDSVLRLRQHEKEQAEIQLAGVLKEQRVLLAQQGALDAEIARINSTHLPVHLGAQRDLFLQSLHIKTHQLGGELRAMEVRVNDARDQAVQAQAALRAVEKLRERQYAEWQVEFQREEDRELAEVAGRKHNEH